MLLRRTQNRPLCSWNIVVGAVVGAVVSAVSTAVSEVKESGLKALKQKDTWKKIGVSAAIGAGAGALTVLCPGASAAFSAVASGAEAGLHGWIDGDSIGEIVTDTLVSCTIGAVAGSGGSDFAKKKGAKLINDAMGSIGKATRRCVHPAVKKTAKRTIRGAARYVGKEYISAQGESFAYGTISEYSSYYIKLVTGQK